MIKKIIMSILILNSILLFAEEDLQAFMVHGEDHIVSVMLPKTWMVNMDFAHQVGVNGFFYLKEYSINDSPAGIILNLAYKPNENSKLEDWINFDLKSFKETHKGFKAEKLDWNVINENKYKVIVYKLYSEKNKEIQYTAYIDAGLKYYVNLYIQIFNESKYNSIYLDNFKICLEQSHLSGIGIKLEKETEK